MLRNFLVIALRNLRRQAMYSVINISGLAVGMACSLVIFLYVYGEWSHDRHFENGDRIYRIGVSFFNIGNFAKGPELLGNFLPNEFEGIEAFTRFQRRPETEIRVGGQLFKDLAYEVDSLFFTVFTYPFKLGDPRSAISGHSAVLTESMALKYFQRTEVIGEVLEVGGDRTPYVITGVVEDDHRNSHLKASLWLTLNFDPGKQYYWSSAAFYNYVLLKENVGRPDLERALDRIVEKYVYPTTGVAMGKKSLEEYLSDPNAVRFHIHALRDIYLRSKLNLELSPGGNETNVIIFGVIALFILVLAAVNFVNLSTARAVRRAREVGVRKTLGTTRTRLIAQFLLESVVVCLFSMTAALALAELFTFAFFWITGQQLSISLWAGPWSVLGVLLFAVAVGIAAGVYPAFYLTSFDPVKVLKSGPSVQRSGSFRNALVVFQFAISITLIICTAVIVRQLNYMSEKDLGFDAKNTVTIDNVDLLGNNLLPFTNELRNRPDVVGASLHTGEPGSKAVMTFYTFQTTEMTNALTINTYFGDEHYLDVMGFQLLQGRNFQAGLASDTASVILNEAAIRELGIADNPIGAVLNTNQKVIGVVRDFHWESLRNDISPTAILVKNEYSSDRAFAQLAVRLESRSAASLLKSAGERWKQLVPEEPFTYHFLDDNFGQLLEKERVLGKAIGMFTVLAIAISCLGLFGLAAYTAEQRTREIGIRKALGATAADILLMLNKQFGVLVLLSILVAVPVSFVAAREWLSEFAYKTSLSPMLFVAGAASGAIISAVTVFFQSMKASQSNPAEILKTE